MPDEERTEERAERQSAGEVTILLERWSDGDEDAFAELVPIVYKELRRLAGYFLRNERADHTLQPTALVHEAYLRLRGVRRMKLTSRAHFYGAAARVMRRVLVDHARARNAKKRTSELAPASLMSLDEALAHPAELLALDKALDALADVAPRKAKVVELRYFGGLSVKETAEYLEASPVTVKRDWAFSRAWLYRRLSGEGEVPGAVS